METRSTGASVGASSLMPHRNSESAVRRRGHLRAPGGPSPRPRRPARPARRRCAPRSSRRGRVDRAPAARDGSPALPMISARLRRRPRQRGVHHRAALHQAVQLLIGALPEVGRARAITRPRLPGGIDGRRRARDSTGTPPGRCRSRTGDRPRAAAARSAAAPSSSMVR